jgi:hypothetical protein
VIDPQSHQPSVIGHWSADSSGLTGTTLGNGIAFDGPHIYLPSGAHLIKFTKTYDSLQVTPGPSMHRPLHIAPNPASDVLHVRDHIDLPGQVHWRIIGVSGAELRSGWVAPLPGDVSFGVDISALSNGFYLIAVDGGEMTRWAKFVVAR